MALAGLAAASGIAAGGPPPFAARYVGIVTGYDGTFHWSIRGLVLERTRVRLAFGDVWQAFYKARKGQVTVESPKASSGPGCTWSAVHDTFSVATAPRNSFTDFGISLHSNAPVDRRWEWVADLEFKKRYTIVSTCPDDTYTPDPPCFFCLDRSGGRPGQVLSGRDVERDKRGRINYSVYWRLYPR